MDETLKKMIDYIRMLEDNLVKLAQEHQALQAKLSTKEGDETAE